MSTINISDPRLTDHLTVAGSWARRLAILNFIFLGLGFLFTLIFFVSAGVSVLSSEFGLAGGYIAIIAVFTLLYLGFFGYLTLKLYRFGSSFKKFSDRSFTNQQVLVGFDNLKKLFFTTVISFGLVVLFYIFMFAAFYSMGLM